MPLQCRLRLAAVGARSVAVHEHSMAEWVAVAVAFEVRRREAFERGPWTVSDMG